MIIRVPENEMDATDMIMDGIRGIAIQRGNRPMYLVQWNGKQGEFESALEAINFYNSTYEEA